MSNEEIQSFITSLHPETVYDTSGEWLSVHVNGPDWSSLCRQLRDSVFAFDYLFCLTCIDWKTHFTVVAHLSSTTYRHTLVLKANLEAEKPEIDTLSLIWRTAEFHEREIFELFGIVFTGHPDLRRLILTDDFEGFPLRKNFEDPVNMIKL